MGQKTKKFVLIALVFILVLIGTTDSVEASSFPDVTKSAGIIEDLNNQGIISGYPDGNFYPDRNVTRAEATTMIGIGINLDGTKRRSSFADVSEKYFASGYIVSAQEAKIISGYPNGLFKPKNHITRGEMAIVIANAFKLTERKDLTYTDVPKNHAKYSAIDLVASAGISSGYPDGSFRPDHAITREHAAILIAGALKHRKENDNVVDIPADVLPDPAHPVYKEVKKYVTAKVLNVRPAPNTTQSPIAQFRKNDEVITKQQVDQWYYVRKGDIKGYVHGDYLADKKASTKRIIAIDPGHGGSEPGASGNGIIEKDINLDVSLRVQSLLEEAGFIVVMTRTTDKTVPLNDRVPIALKGNADTFVSIHANAHPNTAANGTESFYARSVGNERAEQSKQLASYIQMHLLDALDTTNRGVKEMGFRVLRTNPLPAALIELAFITNTGDAAKLKQEAYKVKAAEAIFTGIVDYYEWRER